MADYKFSVRLYGAFDAWLVENERLVIKNQKLRAMIALLISAPDGRRSRTFLRSMLWPLAYDEERGNSSLRQCISSLRGALGPACAYVLDDSDRSCVKLNLEHVEVIGLPTDGLFLEGLDLTGLTEFEDWLRDQRKNTVFAQTLAPPTSLPPVATRPVDRVIPALGVLPFLSLHKGNEHGLLGDMLAEEVARTLSKSHFANIKSHFSCRSINARHVDLDTLKNALNVDYVVSGALVCKANSFRVTVDLIEMATGDFVWSSEFKGDLNAFFASESTVAAEIALAVSKSVLRTSLDLASATPLPDTNSHDLFMSAVYLLHKQDIASSARSRKYLEELLRRAPRNSVVHSWLGLWYVLCLSQGWHDNASLDATRAKDCTARALDLNPTCAFSLSVDGILESNVLKNFDVARQRFEHALDLDPNNAYGCLFSGVSHAIQGAYEPAVAQTRQSRILSPLDPGAYLFDTLSATAELSAMRYVEALALAERSYQRNPMHNSTLRTRTIALHGLGRMEEAKASARELARREPNLTISGYLSTHPAAQFDTGKRWAKALEEAGIRKS
ncbi:hypothetical protein [Roseobacter sp. A03A-229]